MKVDIPLTVEELEYLEKLAEHEYRTPGKQLAFMAVNMLRFEAMEGTPLTTRAEVHQSFNDAQQLDGFKNGEAVKVLATGLTGVIQDITAVDGGRLEVRMEDGIGEEVLALLVNQVEHVT